MNQVYIAPKKKSFEDLDAVDVIRFVWNQRVPIFGSLLLGASIGLFFSKIKEKPAPTTAVTVLLKDIPSTDTSYTQIDPERLLHILNTIPGQEVFYRGALTVTNDEGTSPLENISPAYFRSFVLSAEKLSLDTMQINLGMTSNFHFKKFEKAISAGVSKVIELYNQSQVLPYFYHFERKFELDNQIQGLMAEIASAEKVTNASDQDSRLFSYFIAIPSRTKFDHIAVMLKLLPADSAVKSRFEKAAKDLYRQQTSIDHQIQRILDQNFSKPPVPWMNVSLQTYSVTNETIGESFGAIALPRVMTGLFLGLVVGIVLAGIRSFIQNNRMRLKDIFQPTRIRENANI